MNNKVCQNRKLHSCCYLKKKTLNPYTDFLHNRWVIPEKRDTGYHTW